LAPDVLEIVRSKGLSVTEPNASSSPPRQGLEGDNGKGETVTLHGFVTFEPLQHLVAVKLRSNCKSILVGVAVKPVSKL
jgi:hypothetical protein